jgi:glyoxylase-like metal-dependent hydrolase (beta-lactamase superfamily II)
MKIWFCIALAAMGALTQKCALAQHQLAPDKPPADKPMTVEKVKDGLYVIRGPFSVCATGGCRGPSPKAATDGLMHEAGDVAVRVTPDGVILVDDKFAWQVDELLAKVKSITPLPIKYVLNSHYHQDHTGANAAMLEHGFEVIAQRNLRDEILGKGGARRNEPAAAPRIAFGDFGVLHLGGVEVQMLYLGRAHTSGDTFVYFPDLKTVHTGDVLMDGAPFIDYRGGGSAVEWVKTLYNLLKLDFDTVIPGHGPIFNKQYARDYVQKLEKMNQRMLDLVRAGVPRDRDRLVAGLKLEELGWAHTDSTDTFIENSITDYYDEMAAVLAAAPSGAERKPLP